MSTQKECDNSRRRFLRDIATTAPAVAAATALPLGSVQAEETANSEGERKDKGYHLTQHIADYYDSATV